MPDERVFVVEQLGIKDIDGYGHVWYGNYLKFFLRGLRAFLGGGIVRKVESLKYKRSIPWGADDSRIESYLVSRPSPGMALVYQRWCVGGDADPTHAVCLTLVALEPGTGEAAAITPGGERLIGQGPKLAMAVKNLQTGAVKAADGPIIGKLLYPRIAFPDMLSGSNGGSLSLVDAMDLFEQTRSEVVGGQPGLKAFLARSAHHFSHAHRLNCLHRVLFTPCPRGNPSADTDRSRRHRSRRHRSHPTSLAIPSFPFPSSVETSPSLLTPPHSSSLLLTPPHSSSLLLTPPHTSSGVSL